jgi:hypothetical protein
VHDASWLAFYEFFLCECGLTGADKLRPTMVLAGHTGWWWPFKGAVVVTPRPSALNRDAEHRLDADGELATAYPDGWGVYACHGVRLPEKYGAVKRAEWKARWLLEEQNAELRRVLIEQIGYERICQELEAKKLDSWREYELLRIDDADVEPIMLCKMTCPSTGRIHALRVPPDVKTAREAITVCNHGIDPGEFAAER